MSKSTKPSLRLEAATGNSVLRAYNRAAKRIKEDGIRGASTSAGFIVPKRKRGEPLRGWQVFVSIEAWSQVALEEVPESGGLAKRALKILEDRALAAAINSTANGDRKKRR